MQNLRFAHSDKAVKAYSLDVVISVGDRAKSPAGPRFRQWATKTLKDHILKSYTINRDRIQANYTQFLQAVADVKNLLPAGAVIDNILELIT